MKKRVIILGIIVILLAAAAIYYTFFYSRPCPDMICFNSALADCGRRSIIDETESSVWLYEIKGKSRGECVVRVELLQLREGTTKLASLEGKDMLCYLPSGVVGNPRDNLDSCHGLLKEELQKVIIDNLHTYITDNLGEIGEELGQAL